MVIDYVKALKDNTGQYAVDHIKRVSEHIDDQFCCKHYGISTHRLGFKLGLPTATHRLALRRLEKQGKVISFKYSENQILWWPVGFFAEITGYPH